MVELYYSPKELLQINDSEIKSNDLVKAYSSSNNSGEEENVSCPPEDFSKIENVEKKAMKTISSHKTGQQFTKQT